MADKRDQTKSGATELKEEELHEAQGGVGRISGGGAEATKKVRRSRGNNVFGFEDLPNN